MEPQPPTSPAGDDGAPGRPDFAALYATQAAALYAWARLAVRGPLASLLDAEDLAQEVCYQAWRGFPRFDPARGPFRPWLFGVAHHVVLMLLRKSARLHARAGVVEALASRAGSVPAEATSISRRVARDEELTRFVDRLAQLPDDERKLLTYRGLEGLQHEEVGRLLGLSTEQARKRWQRLRERLVSLPGVDGLLEPA